MWKKYLLVLTFYFAGFFTAMYLLGPADLGKFDANCSRAEVLAAKVHVQLRKIVELTEEKASKVGSTTMARLAKR